jgi:hypothetical protein
MQETENVPGEHPELFRNRIYFENEYINIKK